MEQDRIPMRWPAEWSRPERLKLLEGTPVNCLVGKKPPESSLPDGIEFLSEAPAEVNLVEGVWPGVQAASREEGDTAESGPTGAPWVDSNAATIRLSQALEPTKKVWLDYSPPGPSEVVPFEALPRPVAEAEAYNAHWIITLHESMRKGLESGNPEAMASWKQTMNVLEFSAGHQEWANWQPAAALAVVSDFEGENEFLAGEFLNLAPRRHLAFRIVPKERAESTSYAGQKAILYIDPAPPEGSLKQKFVEFAAGGGLLILPSPIDGLGDPIEERRGYQLYSKGQGHIAVPTEEWYDPYVLAAEIHLLISHREDVVRIWNGGMMNSHFVESPDGKRGIVHLVEYARRRSHYDDVTLGFSRPYKTASVFTLEGVKSVKPIETRLGVEVPLPPFKIYVAVEMGV